jgi:hypothetical protein
VYTWLQLRFLRLDGTLPMSRTNVSPGPPRSLSALACLAAILALSRPGVAAEVNPASAATTDPAARALLLGMADFMARAPAMRVTLRSGYDAIQPDGQRIEFGERRQITMQRPDQIRVELERSDGEKGTVVFDGRWITAFNARENVYARVERPGNVDQALVYMVRDLQAILPLARMFTTFFPKDLDQRAMSVAYVETSTMLDVPTDHLAVRSADVDLQLWITRGPEPLPRRVSITYKNEPGQPQFRAELYDWQLAPTLEAGAFAFVPPVGAEQIPYLAPKPRVAPPPTVAGDQP